MHFIPNATLMWKIAFAKRIKKFYFNCKNEDFCLSTNSRKKSLEMQIIADEFGIPINFRYLEVNPAFERLTGIKSKNIIGKTVREILPNSADHWVQIFGEVALTGKSFKFEDYSPEFNKFFSISAFSFKKGFFAVVFEDITKSKLSEKLIASERERLAVTLYSIGDGVISTDTYGKIVMINKSAQELLGWDSEEAVGLHLKDIFTIINEITRLQMENPVDKLIRTGKKIKPESHTLLVTRTGKEMTIAHNADPILDNDNQIIGLVLVFRDMTEKIKLIPVCDKEEFTHMRKVRSFKL